MNKIITYAFLCICLITLILSQFQFRYTIDLGTDYAGIMATEQSYSTTGVSTTRYISINILGWLIIIISFISILYLYVQMDNTSCLKSIIPFSVFIISFIAMISLMVYRCRSEIFIILIIFVLISDIYFMSIKAMHFPEFIISFMVLLMIFNNSQSAVHKPRPQKLLKACYTNMRVISSAAEMYNMDVDEKHMMDELDISQLVSTSYLKSAPFCPATHDTDSYGGSYLTTTGQVYCLYKGGGSPEYEHGYIDMAGSPEDKNIKSQDKKYTLSVFFHP